MVAPKKHLMGKHLHMWHVRYQAVTALLCFLFKEQKSTVFSLSEHTLLHYCTTKEATACSKQLIWKGSNLDVHSNNNDEDTPLHTPAWFGLPELLALYGGCCADVDSINSYMETPLITTDFWSLK
ncbi:UNVERIFIED_CONTAM: hypothetical protein FKN15_013727 [Acipenser sinensis]